MSTRKRAKHPSLNEMVKWLRSYVMSLTTDESSEVLPDSDAGIYLVYHPDEGFSIVTMVSETPTSVGWRRSDFSNPKGYDPVELTSGKCDAIPQPATVLLRDVPFLRYSTTDKAYQFVDMGGYASANVVRALRFLLNRGD